GVELLGFGEVAQIARVHDEIRLARQRVDLVDGRLKCADHIAVGLAVETDVRVADLHECRRRTGNVCRRRDVGTAERPADQTGRRQTVHHARAAPCHAFEEAAAIDLVLRIHQLPPTTTTPFMYG